jgi:hypothetical protein
VRALELAVQELGQSLGPASHVLTRLVEHAPNGKVRMGAGRVHHQHGLEGGHLHLVHADCAGDRVAAQSFHEVGSTEHDPGLRSAQQLVPGEDDEVRSVA